MSKIWYAVQTEEYDAWDWGSTRKREALKIAKAEAKKNPEMMVKIAAIETNTDYCVYEIVVQEGAKRLQEYRVSDYI